MILSVYILNKAGGLIYQRDFQPAQRQSQEEEPSFSVEKLSSNEYLVLAGTFHGIHAIASKISPVAGSSGIQTLEAETFRLQCFQTHTGTKFLVVTDPAQRNTAGIMRRIYELYADYVMKNPFYQLEMPVRCEAFDQNLSAFVAS